MRSHHIWLFLKTLLLETLQKTNTQAFAFLYHRVFTKVLIEKGTLPFSKGRVMSDKSLIRKGRAILRKILIDPEESHKSVREGKEELRVMRAVFFERWRVGSKKEESYSKEKLFKKEEKKS